MSGPNASLETTVETTETTKAPCRPDLWGERAFASGGLFAEPSDQGVCRGGGVANPLDCRRKSPGSRGRGLQDRKSLRHVGIVVTMLLAYVDESGDKGAKGSDTYSLGCLMLSADDWPSSFDAMLNFRRFLKTRYGIRARAEIKANYLMRGKKDLTGLGDSQREAIYRSHMRMVPKISGSAFAVVIEKRALVVGRDPFDTAWEFLLQRLERESDRTGHPVMVVHDEGDNLGVRKIARKARRAGSAGSAFGTTYFKRPFTALLDDPVPRDSQQSYFLQLADLIAYSGFRAIHPSTHPRSICPQTMWNELGTGIYFHANKLKRHPGAPQGVVVWP